MPFWKQFGLASRLSYIIQFIYVVLSLQVEMMIFLAPHLRSEFIIHSKPGSKRNNNNAKSSTKWNWHLSTTSERIINKNPLLLLLVKWTKIHCDCCCCSQTLVSTKWNWHVSAKLWCRLSEIDIYCMRVSKTFVDAKRYLINVVL
jgi:hypothetical protein